MSTEIERKWFAINLPPLNKDEAIVYERYYLYIGNAVEVRIQKKGSKYEFERKVATSNLTRVNQKFEISKEEFEVFKKLAKGKIVRESYMLPDIPNATLKIYKENLEGLNRIEIEFETEEASMIFEPLDWFGKEITDTALGRDSRLIALSEEEFKNLLKKYP